MAPSAIASATSGETAPLLSISFASTPSSFVLDSFEYETTPPANHRDEPGRSVSRPARSPPLSDSATAMVRSPSSRKMTSSIDSPLSV